MVGRSNVGKSSLINAVLNRKGVARVSQTPGKLLLSGLSPVVFPALAAEVRKGGDLKAPFLTAVSYISGVYWPAFVLLEYPDSYDAGAADTLGVEFDRASCRPVANNLTRVVQLCRWR